MLYLLAGLEAYERIFLIEGEGEILHCAGAEVSERKSGIDLDEWPQECVVAQAEIRGKAGGLEFEAR